MNVHLTRPASWLLLLSVMICFPTDFLQAQGTFSGSVRHFVTSVTPVFGPNGLIGGIHVDADGVVAGANIDTSGRLAQMRAQPINEASADLRKASALRKISLRKLDEELTRLHKEQLPLPAEIECLAGLQRIEYVFIDQKNKDIILAGPAEGWQVADNGFVVGENSGLPVIDFCDLITMLRFDAGELAGGMTCSMDATPEGMKRYTDFLRSDPQLNEETLQEMRDAIGNFSVSFTGVSGDSHFARMLIAADVMMKRLAMNLEQSPVRGVKGYVEMLQRSTKKISPNSSPRWWLTSHYETLLRDEAGLAWEIRGPGVKTMTSEDFLDRNGVPVDTRRVNRLAERWAEDFTENFEALSAALPIFGQLRNGMDLAVIAALLHRYELFDKAGFTPVMLTDPEKIQLVTYPLPKFTPPQVSHARGRRNWIVTVSGGVAIDGWSPVSVAQVDDDLKAIRQQAVASANNRWWWD